MKFQMQKSTRLGNRVVNEDRIGFAERQGAALLVLADGMGGYRGGQIAAKALVNQMVCQFKRSRFPVEDPRAYLKELVADAHLAVIRAGAEQYPPIEPRTTCVVCLVQGDHAWWAHVGDSRLYLFRGGEPFFRTTDHSKLQEMLRKGKLSAEEIANHPKRHMVTRCVGYQKIPPVPAISEAMPLEKYDMLLLCSDGFWNPLSDQNMADNLTQYPLAKAVERLAYQAEFRSYPESDNISVIVLRWISDEATVEEPLAEDSQEIVCPDELLDTLDELDRAMGKMQDKKA